MADDRAVGPRSGVGGPKPKQADSLPVPPGGERQNPREPRDVVADALAGQHTVSTIDRDFAAHLALDALSAAGWRLVPVGGAPHPRVEAWIGLLLGGEAPQAFLEDPSLARDIAAYLESAFAEGFGRAVGARLAAAGGAPRDEEIAERTRLDPDRVRDVLDARDVQNDDVETLAEARGFTDEERRVLIALTDERMANRTGPVDTATGAIYLSARAKLEPRDDRSEYPNPEPSSGAAPKGDEWRAGYQAGRMETLEVVQNSRIGFPARKGEQEKVDESSASWQNGYEVGFEHAKVASPPPDRLTPEEIRALLLMVPSGPLPSGGHEARAIASAHDKLRARLSDREPE